VYLGRTADIREKMTIFAKLFKKVFLGLRPFEKNPGYHTAQTFIESFTRWDQGSIIGLAGD
jgi:hypothetical protein